jgi:SAM-dependent methyltransferase
MQKLLTPLVLAAIFTTANLLGQVAAYISYSDARPIFLSLQEHLWPEELMGKTPSEIEHAWPDWVSRRDAAIRARVGAGDEDSIINLLQFGTTFTKQPRITEQQLAGVAVRQAGSSSTVFVPSPLLRARIEDFVTAVASPGTNERLQFARRVIDRRGFDPTSEEGRSRLRRYLEDRTAVVGSAVHASTLHDPSAELIDQLTIFHDRGLASDTAVWIDFGIEQALDAMKASGTIRPGTIRRVGIIGPGLDFTDKQEGYDFYPQQTIQPFALVDSLMRLGLSASTALQVDAFDLSPRVIQHLDAARERARAGSPYAVALPRNLDQPWTPGLVNYWRRFGDRIGTETKGVAPPPSAGRVDARRVLVRPSVVLSMTPRDVNIVVQRLEPLAEGERFDLIVATNILIYYDVFEQSLALVNIAKMLRPGGVFLTNDRVFELPGTLLGSVGYTDVNYMSLPGVGETGDRIVWYQRN